LEDEPSVRSLEFENWTQGDYGLICEDGTQSIYFQKKMRRHSPYNIDPDGMEPNAGATELIAWARMQVAMQDGDDRLKRMAGKETQE